MKKYMRRLFSILLIVFLLILIILIPNYVDGARVTAGKEPIYCAKVSSSYSNKVTYWGLGYKVIRYVNESPDEPFEDSLGVKMGSWFMDYELPSDHPKSKNEVKMMEDLDDFYHTVLTENDDIRALSSEYHFSDAIKDQCLAIGSTIHNAYLYDDFMKNYQNHNDAFIRVAQTSDEGDLILSDLLYDANSDTIYLVEDNTRDEYAAKEDRQITMKHFNHMEERTMGDERHWIVYQDPMNMQDEQFENVKIVAVLK